MQATETIWQTLELALVTRGVIQLQFIDHYRGNPITVQMSLNGMGNMTQTTRDEVEEGVETWKNIVFERHGLKISRTKTEYLLSPSNQTKTTVKIVDVGLPRYSDILLVGERLSVWTTFIKHS